VKEVSDKIFRWFKNQDLKLEAKPCKSNDTHKIFYGNGAGHCYATVKKNIIPDFHEIFTMGDNDFYLCDQENHHKYSGFNICATCGADLERGPSMDMNRSYFELEDEKEKEIV